MRVVLSLIVLIVMSADIAQGQRRSQRPDAWPFGRGEAPPEFGVRGGYDFDAEVGSAGAQLRIPLIRELLVVPSGDVYFATDSQGTDWQLNADLVARPGQLGGVYGGLGAAFMQTDFDGDGAQEVEVGYNLLAGMEAAPVLRTRLRPFAEARWSVVDHLDPFRLIAGINTPVR